MVFQIFSSSEVQVLPYPYPIFFTGTDTGCQTMPLKISKAYILNAANK